MTANESRIGNYLHENVYDSAKGIYEKFKIKIESIHKTHITCQDDCIYNVCDLEPIPLTEEWLLRFGFSQGFISDPQEVDAESRYWIGDFTLIFAPNEGVIFWKNDKFLKLKYVHQLQNLYFALTNKELNYESTSI